MGGHRYRQSGYRPEWAAILAVVDAIHAKDALLCVPTPEHYLPMLYVLGASFPGEPVTFPVEGMDGGSVSMLAVRFG